ncbi:hypothetical protein BDR07DRAFT_1380905 [Suillus spraguei]|nr:hypothetical protein BDR07DRAFT_1380905 [Suillus spraguei]
MGSHSPIEAFPQIYQWMTFGVTSLLERIWEYQYPLLKLERKPSPQMIEICAMLERALAFAHTGNAKVLSSSLMRPFWLIRSLLQQGWPTMASTIRIMATTTIPVSVSPADWPVVTHSNLPAIASKRSQIITYGLDHFELSIHNPSPNLFMQYDQDLRHAILIAVVAFQSFIGDVKSLVTVAVTKLCTDLDNEDTHSSSLEAKNRRHNLKKWLACKHPLSYLDRAFEYLLCSVVSDSDDYSLGLPNPTKEKLSIRDFAKLLVDMSRPTDPVSIAAPLISTGTSPMVFRVALVYMSKFVPRDSPNAANLFLQNAFIIAANHLHINNIPWHLAGGRGRRFQKPHFLSWINLGKAAQLPTAKLLAPHGINGAEEASQRTQASDSRAAWAACSITLQSLPDFLSRTIPPDEFCMNNVGLDVSNSKKSNKRVNRNAVPDSNQQKLKCIIRDTYQWAFAEFDMSRPLHQLAILVGIYVSKVVPDIFYDYDDFPDHESYKTMLDFTLAVHEMRWLPHTGGRKGCKVAAQFITMVPVYIMAVFDYSSPLHGHFDVFKSFPTAWNKKHSNKGIGPLLLIRLGLAKARSGRIWKGGVLNSDWSLLTKDEVTKYHQKILTMLADRQFGPYRVAQLLFGSDKARKLGVALTSLGKRKASSSSTFADDEDDDEVEIYEMDEPVSRRRRIY